MCAESVAADEGVGGLDEGHEFFDGGSGGDDLCVWDLGEEFLEEGLFSVAGASGEYEAVLKFG